MNFNNEIISEEKQVLNIFQSFSLFFQKKVKIGVYNSLIYFRKLDIEYLFKFEKRTIVNVLHKKLSCDLTNPFTGEKYKGKDQYINLSGLRFILNKNMKYTEQFITIEKIIYEVYFRAKFGFQNLNNNISDFYDVNVEVIQEKKKTCKRINNNLEISTKKLSDSKLSEESDSIKKIKIEEISIIDELETATKNLSISKLSRENIKLPENWKKEDKNGKLYYIQKFNNTLFFKKDTEENLKKKFNENINEKKKIIYVSKFNLYSIIMYISESYEKNFGIPIISNETPAIFEIEDNFTFDEDILPVLLMLEVENISLN